MPGQQGSAARLPSGLRAVRPGKAGRDDLIQMEEESGVTLRRSAPGALAPEVSSPAALAKARALKARADLMLNSKWCGLTSYARPSRGGRESHSFLQLQQQTNHKNNSTNNSSTKTCSTMTT
eukprot:COSAG06_NODE_16712_length_985_cov_1.417607_1_plen_121_part_10